MNIQFKKLSIIVLLLTMQSTMIHSEYIAAASYLSVVPGSSFSINGQPLVGQYNSGTIKIAPDYFDAYYNGSNTYTAGTITAVITIVVRATSAHNWQTEGVTPNYTLDGTCTIIMSDSTGVAYSIAGDTTIIPIVAGVFSSIPLVSRGTTPATATASLSSNGTLSIS